MKIKTFIVTLLIILIVSLFVTSLLQTRVYGQNSKPRSTFPKNAQIDFVNHTIQTLYPGSIIVNDTVQVSAVSGKSETLQNIFIGFPYNFKFNLFYCAAFNTSTQEQLDIELDVGLGRQGYYGVNVIFPRLVELNDGKFCRFTVAFVFSNVTTMSEIEIPPTESGEEAQNQTIDQATVTFPLYPSFEVDAVTCNVSFILLPDTTCNNPEELSGFAKTTIGIYEVWKYSKSPLERFAYESAQFKIIPNVAQGPALTQFDVDNMEVKVELKEPEQLLITSIVQFTNTHVLVLEAFQLRIPQNATGLSMWDDVGNTLNPAIMNRTANIYTTLLKTPLPSNRSIRIKVAYSLPWEKYVSQINWQNFNFSFIIDTVDFVIRKVTINVVLPENAKFMKFQAPPVAALFAIQKASFQEQATFTFYNATPLQKYRINFEYQYSLFWSSFRPTLWVGSLLALICAIAVVWRAPKPSVQVSVAPVSPKLLKSFVDSYEKKNQMLSKLELIEERASKGRMSRREYKIQKRTLENNLSVVEKELVNLKEKLRSTGSRYAEVMKQLEFAETEREEAKAGERRVKARYSRGELALDAYRKLLEDYAKRKERAETTIDGALISLREGII